MRKLVRWAPRLRPNVLITTYRYYQNKSVTRPNRLYQQQAHFIRIYSIPAEARPVSQRMVKGESVVGISIQMQHIDISRLDNEQVSVQSLSRRCQTKPDSEHYSTEHQSPWAVHSIHDLTAPTSTQSSHEDILVMHHPQSSRSDFQSLKSLSLNIIIDRPESFTVY